MMSSAMSLHETIQDLDDLEFTLLETSLDGDGFAVLECTKENKNLLTLPKTLLPLGVPDLLKPIAGLVEDKLMRPLTEESCFHDDAIPRFWQREIDIASLYSLPLNPLQTSIQVERNPTNGKLLGFHETEMIEECSRTALSGSDKSSKKLDLEVFFKETFVTPEIFKKDLLCRPPGFEHGLDIAPNQDDTSRASFNVSNLWFEHEVPEVDDEVGLDKVSSFESGPHHDDEELDCFTDAGRDIGSNLIEATTGSNKERPARSIEEKWAEVVDINQSVNDFHKLIPDMPHKWPFELDSFQKHAVLRLERNQSVFVSAHTSAGKTVVAEYAIALTAKHMTRVVYTSPIKALSNQKFRDFKQTFSDVGLITGDVQICPEAFCLVMTTEILRSMLYNGSDVIRDLEWVIFDEVHYINDSERGVVWEEVLIMLPEHCNIILLSATVPNAFEFANWIGRTKQRKIFVVSTLKRPVPLEHYLYTGNSTKSSNEMFMLVDNERRFLKEGYKKAMDAKNERMSKHSRSFGAKGRTGGGYSADKGVWLSLIARLRKHDQLPVVAFTFSRRRCNDNAITLDSLDLTSSSEKREIKLFFEKCVRRLKGPDRSLPQVLQMATLLDRGVGIHHSGILPILKEVVEMLFAKGLVKLLFATETFAMGVNMPARTVVFDSIRKHDGTQMRNLLPGEYIQMAGRAGRRGLDSTGNVIILCKGDVPEMGELHTMMLGRVTRLQSQFRLTYGMILNLLRVEQLRVEEVMRKSFSEFNSRKNSKIQEEELRSLKNEMESRSDVEELLRRTDYEQYYLCCRELLSLRFRVLEELLSNNVRIMSSGRVIVLDLPSHPFHVAVVLKTNTSRAEKSFLTLMLLDDTTDPMMDSNRWTRDRILLKTLHQPQSNPTQLLVEVKVSEISYVTAKVIKVHAETIIADCKKRQLPRFRSDPIDQSTSLATQQLMRLVDSHPTGLPEINAKSELGTNTMELIEDISKIKSLESSVRDCFQCAELPRFNSQMNEVESYLQLKDKFYNLKYLLSDESLFLLPEYHQRVKVLEKLRYVDSNGAVQMKGRVSCEISTHELLLTELVFENVLSPFESSEIVALLSCCVFQQNVDMDEVTLTTQLKNGMLRIKDVGEMIGKTQIECGMRESPDEFVSSLKFGLVEVVHEWAKGTSFKDITNLTSVQEGVIVRTIQRLSELCKDVRNAARVIGDPLLYSKMDKCSELVKRDIVFAASLYTH